MTSVHEILVGFSITGGFILGVVMGHFGIIFYFICMRLWEGE